MFYLESALNFAVYSPLPLSFLTHSRFSLALTLLTMRSFAALLGLSLLASSAAYQVTFPAAPGDQWRAGAVRTSCWCGIYVPTLL